MWPFLLLAHDVFKFYTHTHCYMGTWTRLFKSIQINLNVNCIYLFLSIIVYWVECDEQASFFSFFSLSLSLSLYIYSWLTIFQAHSKVVQLYMYTYIIFHVIFHYRLLQDIDYGSLCYRVNLCCLLHIYFFLFYSY